MFILSASLNREKLVVFLIALFILPTHSSASLSVVASFSQKGVTGVINFTQPSVTSPTIISLSLSGLDQLPNEQYPWHVHQYPFSGALDEPCSPSSVGGHYDPFGASKVADYTTNCKLNKSLCEVGDLSGKFGPLNSTRTSFNIEDSSLDLYGQYSIIGRSLVLHFSNGSRYVCANIRYPQEEDTITSYVPLRGGRIGGNIYMVQYSDNATSVHSKLFSTDATSLNHNWHVHSNPVSSGDTSCSSTGGHYNPRGVNTTGDYSMLCSGSSPLQCEVGDLSGKGGRLNFENNFGQSFYTDTDLPMNINSIISIANRSIVIHAADAGSGRVVCGNIIGTSPRQAIATFNGDEGISGSIKFKQATPFTETKVEVSLSGLSGNADQYHIYQTPVGEGIQGHQRCSMRYVGIRWNPRGVVYGNNERISSDQYEVGDLSGKFGSLNGSNTYKGEFSDMNIPLFGRDSIIGRSIVIRDKNALRWVCANIQYDMPTVEGTAMLNVSGNLIRFSFVQPASDPYADTTIFVQSVEPASQATNTTFSSSFTTVTHSQSTPSQFLTTTSSSQTSQTPGQPFTVSTTTSSSVPVLSTVSSSPSSLTSADTLTSSSSLSVSFTVSPSSTSQTSTKTSTISFTESSSSVLLMVNSSMAASSSVFVSTSSNSSSVSIPPFSSSTSSSVSSSSSSVPVSSFSQSNMSSSSSSLLLLSSTSSSLLNATSSSLGSTVSSSASAVFSNSTSSSLVSTSSSISVSVSASSTPSPGRRRRGISLGSIESYDEKINLPVGPGLDDSQLIDDRDAYDDRLRINKRETTEIRWSIRKTNGGKQPSNDCGSLEEFLKPVADSESLCESGVEQLACSAGDLTKKHEPLQVDSEEGVRMVFTDPYLPLSGPDSALGNVLLIEGGGSSQYIKISSGDSQEEPVSCTATNTPSASSQPPSTSTRSSVTSSSSMASDTTTSPKSSSSAIFPLTLPVLIPMCAGGFFVVIILVVLVIVIIVCCARRRDRYRFQEYMSSKTSGVELGMYKRVNPVYRSPTYKVLYDYAPQQDGDLELHQDEMLTLIEAPAGGDWWKGSVDDREGWFPKNYVEYVDVEEEQKKKKEAEIDRVEAVIKAYTLAGSRTSAIEVDSTPKLVFKFNEPIKEEQESSFTAKLPNTPPESNPGTPLLDDRKIIPISPLLTDSPLTSPTSSSNQSPPPHGGDSITSTSQSPPSSSCSPVPEDDIYIARFDLEPDSESELKLMAGQRVVIIERADNGWWHGVVDESHGWVPETFLRPLKETGNENIGNGNNESGQESTDENPFRPRGMTEFHSGTSEEVNASEYRALADYKTETEGDLSFVEGDVLLVYWANENGWWFGAAGSAQGWFPGSYVEPVMEDAMPSPTADTTSEAAKDTAEDVGTQNTAGTPGGETISLGDAIAAALKKKEDRQQAGLELTKKREQTSSPTLPTGGGGSLANDLAAALKKKEERRKSRLEEQPNPLKAKAASSTEGNIAEAPKKGEDNQEPPLVEKTPPTRERGGSVDRLGDDIMSMITNMASEDTVAKETPKEPPKEPLADNVSIHTRQPHRKAPPPPSTAGRNGGNRKSKARSKSRPTSTVSTEAHPAQSGTIPVPPPPPPLPGVVTQPKPPLTESETNKTETTVSIGQPVSKDINGRPSTPGSTSSRRRRPPSPPPSPLVSHNILNPPHTPSSLVTHTTSAETSTTTALTVNATDTQQRMPLVGKSPSLRPNKADELRMKTSVQRSKSSSSWQPQNKRSSWKPQIKNSKKEPAPRREPPKPPSSVKTSPPRVKVQKVKRPGKNIPPPPSVPLPPPPTKSKVPPPVSQLPPPPQEKQKSLGPPPIRKVLSGPPQVKQVKGGPPPVKKVLKSTSSSPEPADSNVPVKADTTSGKLSIQMAAGKDTDNENPQLSPVNNLLPPPIIVESSCASESKPPEEGKAFATDNESKTSTKDNNTGVSKASQNDDAPKDITPTNPKPKVKPAVSPKPKNLKRATVQRSSSTNERPPVKPRPPVKEQQVIKPRPVPPQRTSSLSNTPNASPCPSPVIPRNQESPFEQPDSGTEKLTLQDSSSQKSTEDAINGKDTEVHEIPKPAMRESKTVPPKPAPPKSTNERSSDGGSVQTTPPHASNEDSNDESVRQATKPASIARRDSKNVPPRPAPPRSIKGRRNDENSDQTAPPHLSNGEVHVHVQMDGDMVGKMSEPVQNAERDSKSIPPRPAPPRTVQPKETTDTSVPPQPRPRKVSEQRTGVNHLMSSMKQLEARPERSHPTPSSPVSESPDDKTSETTVEIKPVAKRRTSKSNQETDPTKRASIPSRPPPPPVAAKPISKIGNKNSSEPLTNSLEPLTNGLTSEETNST